MKELLEDFPSVSLPRQIVVIQTMSNESRSQTNIKDFHKDTSVKIKFGELTEDDISGKVRVQLQGALRDPICEGVYEMTDRYIGGKPIYKNKHGYILQGYVLGWNIVGS